ncbi:MAG: YegS/Rv2252/BmrU family lipid kinase [Nannocystaceae bacterium]|nr:YegS/Rv2252/BmrU family lipid kinase [Nannocystaceae bacterium]
MAVPAIVIVNPASGNGRTLRRWPQLQAALRERLGAVEIVHTEAPGHATLLCRRALERGATLVVSVGGDGTNNEVLCGFVDDEGRNRFPHAELGLLPSGTGGDFVRHLGAAAFATVLDALAAAPAHAIDYGIAHFVDRHGHPTVRPFLNVASAGLSGLVDDAVRRSNRWLGPTATYLLGTLRALAEHRAKPVRIGIDAREPFTMSLDLAVVANGQYFGGGMWIAPRARCSDGSFDALWTGDGSKLRLVGLLAKVFRGAHADDAAVGAAAARTVTLEPCNDDDVVLLDLDGEQPGRLPARFELVEGGLRLRAPGLPGPLRTRA